MNPYNDYPGWYISSNGTKSGATGATGAAGLTGATGATGAAGVDGLTGATGATGAAGPQGSTGTGGALGYYGSFYSTQGQTGATADTAYPFTYNITASNNGISITDNSKIKFDATGIYDLQFSVQLFLAGPPNNDANVQIWLKKNNINIDDTNTLVSVQKDNPYVVPAWDFILDVTDTNDLYELVWATNNTDIEIIYTAAGGIYPSIPSIILTVMQVMYTQLGATGATGAAGLDGLTGATGATGAAGLDGHTGATGAAGLDGLTGATGATGAAGLDGLTGATGATGPPGTITPGPTGTFLISGSTGTEWTSIIQKTGNTELTVTGNLVPSTDALYTLGTTGARWAELFVGRGTINIAGPIGSTAVGTIGTDENAIVYTEFGFASPFLNVGAGITLPSTVGGWRIGSSGAQGSPDYDLVAQEINPGSTGTTGPVYSLIKGKTGSTGATGSTGSTGPAGATGATGPAGPTGIGPDGITYGAYLYWNGTTWTPSSNEIKIGTYTGYTGQGDYSIAIGANAGTTGQGHYSIAIGANAIPSTGSQEPHSIILNASSTPIGSTGSTGSFYAKPLRISGGGGAMRYNDTSNEITYTSSSLNTKTNVNSLTIPEHNPIYDLQPKSYEFISDQGIMLTGYIVEEITFNRFATYNKPNGPSVSINYEAIVVYLVEEVKRLNERINNL